MLADAYIVLLYGIFLALGIAILFRFLRFMRSVATYYDEQNRHAAKYRRKG
jgi:hypothetical protein